MNIYEKLQKCRMDLQNSKIKKTGKNKFSGYDYFELGDFLPKINELFTTNKLCSVVSFDPMLATLTVIDSEKPEDKIIFTSPMANAELKGCHPVQNLGATETYERRYLYIAAMEIVEADILDRNGTGRAGDGEIEQRFTLTKDGTNLCKICGKKLTKGDVIVKVGGQWVGEESCYLKQKGEIK